MNDLALNKPALQSSIPAWSTSKSAAIDARFGNSDDPDGNPVLHTGREASPWWQVDLESHVVVERVSVTNWQPTAARFVNFTVLASPDGKQWSPIYKKADGRVFGNQDNEPYVCDIRQPYLARFVRIRLDASTYLSFRQCRVFGREPDAAEATELAQSQEAARQARLAVPDGRTGFVFEIDDCAVFADTAVFSPPIVSAIKGGWYEAREREAAKAGLRTGDRVIEAGTAIGVVTMTMASIVGPQNVATFDGNPAILHHATGNFRRNGFGAISARNGLLVNRSKMERSGPTAKFNVSREFVSSRIETGRASGDITEILDIPVFCLEDEIARLQANALVLDIEGAEVGLLEGADLTGISTIIMETHYHFAGRRETDRTMRDLCQQGFDLDLAVSGQQVVLLTR